MRPRVVLFAAPVAIVLTLLWHEAWGAIHGGSVDVLRDSDAVKWQAVTLSARGLGLCWAELDGVQRCAAMPFNQLTPLYAWCLASMCAFIADVTHRAIRKRNNKHT